MIRRTDPLVAADRVSVAEARCERAIRVLADVMRTLRSAAGSPQEQQVYARARELLAESGVAAAEAAEYHAAFAEWELRKGSRSCVHLSQAMDGSCFGCGMAAQPACQHVHPEHGGSLVFEGLCFKCGERP